MALKVTGIRETLRDLKKMDADLEKELRKRINQEVRNLVVLARGYVPAESPMSGWTAENWGTRGWNSASVRRGIKRENPSKRVYGGGWQYGIAVSNLTAAGAVYELAGSKTDGRSPQGEQFIRNIANTPGGLRTPLRRLVVRAGVERGEQTRQAIEQAVEDAARVTQRRLDSRRG